MRRIAVTALFAALRLCIISACTVTVGVAAALIGEAVLHAPSSSDWGFFGRAGYEAAWGGVAGLLLGLTLAIRLGRTRFTRSARVLQALAGPAVLVLLMLGQCMEG